MKKTIALFALVLCILAGLVSGSLALYTTTAEFDGVGSVVAKKFVLTAEGTQGFGDNLLIAPEDKVESVFTVSNFDGTNVTEVPMELDIEIVIEDAAEDIAAIPNIVAKLIDTTNSTEYPIPLTDGKGSLDLSVPTAFEANEELTFTYKLEFSGIQTMQPTSSIRARASVPSTA
ncbi:MAG: hypothetical protein GX250_08055 [Clostridiales bacterium]|nr:hypothetical protein [Clostridiales bacterium]